MRRIAIGLIAAALCDSLARAADTALVRDFGNGSELGLSADYAGNAKQSNAWTNPLHSATSTTSPSPWRNKSTANGFAKTNQRALAPNASAAWLPNVPQPWATVLITLIGLTAAIALTLFARLWIRTRRARRSRSAVASVLTARLIQTQQQSLRKPESEERKKSRRAA